MNILQTTISGELYSDKKLISLKRKMETLMRLNLNGKAEVEIKFLNRF